ncbi:multidrug effflux MFS transporter [Salinithrix halophila]|uniref:Bcr/CflA family efflux transporter n=1 Tax=Salinithrix halophila TaxID=1485204 RepID=A0ABV8JCB2_9BACL
MNRKFLTMILILMVCLPQASIGLYVPSLPHMMVGFRATEMEMQLTMSVFMAGYAVSALISGILADRFGRKPVAVIGLAVFVIASLACLFAPHVWFLIGSRFFQALGGCCGTTLSRVMTRDTFDAQDQVKVLTYLSMAIAVTPAITPMIGGYLETWYGWQLSFAALAGAGTFLLGAVWFGVKETAPSRNEQAAKAGVIFRNYKHLMTNKYFLLFSLTISLTWCAYFTFITSSSFVLQGVMGASPIWYGVAYAVVVAGYMVGTALTRRLSKAFELNRIILVESLLAFAASAGMLVWIWFQPHSLLGIVLPMSVMMIGIGGIFPACHAAVLKPFDAIAGTASGLFFFLQMISGAVCGVIIGLFHTDSALPMVLTIHLFCLALLLSFYWLGWKENRSLYQEDQTSTQKVV